ncbi:SDR family oxidoreductase [Streptococcus uberis]|uniref:SDR family NAD(P)-dependent oxidoreductase n=1 Tax=Streptococcus uberis TaxID=1349 RepID=UPI001FF445B0|nr:SDR family oxidoreductase [Streptococcus uberis]MCK1165588.1 SDR family oxidoreductase [Streptococcus uberis]MCK1189070.1 SDR family oxidoreductase [Streptococcus uberis]MCK1252274.1 SDR family oxidoreductase [Streptococcus uberis]
MSQRTILITGASGGLAQAIINQLPQEDFLILLGRDQDKLEEMYVNHLHKVCIGLDITDGQAIQQTLADIQNRYGFIDILINNAGFGAFKTYQEFTRSEIEDMFKVNTLASIDFARLVAKDMERRKQGHIINIVSMAGLIASTKSSIYSATKFAMIGFSNALRLELADHHVFVTTVNPGPIATQFFDQADPSGNYLKSVEKFTLSPQQVAKKIVASFGKNKREINLPLTLAVTHKCYTLFPHISDFLARKVFNYK